MAKIYVNYGNQIMEDARRLLHESDITHYLKKEMSVAIKPNLVLSRPAEEGATTHPQVVEGVILFLKDTGVKNISVMESSWVGDDTKKAYKRCGYEPLRDKYNIPLIDLKDDGVITKDAEGCGIPVCRKALETDFLINVPVLKAHCQTLLTCCMKNLKGVIPDSEKRRFHTMGIHKPVAALNKIITAGYNLVDGICGDLTFEEGGSPIPGHRLICGRNSLAVDSYCAALIGLMPDEIGYLREGLRMGLGEYAKEGDIIEFNRDNKPPALPKKINAAVPYIDLIKEDGACSACYASLIHALHRLRVRKARVCIGQGFKNKKGGTGDLGIGVCCGGFSKFIMGCPPKASDIVSFLKKHIV